MVMAVLPDGGDLRGLAAAIVGSVISGAVGEATAVRKVLAALGLAEKPVRRDADEPGFAMSLTELQVPDVTGMRLVPADAGLRDMLVEWRSAYCQELMGAGADDAEVTAQRDIDAYIAAGSHRVLLRGGIPVAMTGFNAALPEIVQVGGVYVPPVLRGQGLARRAVALHLQDARTQGVARAVLFAANDAAGRAYRAIGFQRKGTMALVLFDAEHRIAA
jgi:GNAT superfamily N-acetyltransferase